MNPKQRAAEAALKFVQSGMIVGLGTGSTADQFLQALSAAIKAGTIRDIRGVPTSRQSERRAEALGIPLLTLAECPEPDVTIDGADEVAPNLDLIKGLGGALLREKIVAQNSRRLVIIADASKSVAKLGTHSMLPVEVVPFAHEVQEPFLRSLGATPALRRGADGTAFVTDNGNYIYDCRFENGIEQPGELEARLRGRAGVVETGLFLGLASVALVADEEGVKEYTRKLAVQSSRARQK
jgi:ribose 5-phosphate isomerase A